MRAERAPQLKPAVGATGVVDDLLLEIRSRGGEIAGAAVGLGAHQEHVGIRRLRVRDLVERHQRRGRVPAAEREQPAIEARREIWRERRLRLELDRLAVFLLGTIQLLHLLERIAEQVVRHGRSRAPIHRVRRGLRRRLGVGRERRARLDHRARGEAVVETAQRREPARAISVGGTRRQAGGGGREFARLRRGEPAAFQRPGRLVVGLQKRRDAGQRGRVGRLNAGCAAVEHTGDDQAHERHADGEAFRPRTRARHRRPRRHGVRDLGWSVVLARGRRRQSHRSAGGQRHRRRRPRLRRRRGG